MMLASVRYVRSCAVSLACFPVVTRSVRAASRDVVLMAVTVDGFPVFQNVRFVVSRMHLLLKGLVHCQPTGCCQEY